MQALSIKQLRKVYANDVEALAGIDLTVAEGEFFGLLGPNGAGKSTTIGILFSLVSKSSGQVKIFDIDIEKNFSQAKRLIGLVPQEFNFNVFETPLLILLNQAGYYGIPRHIARKRAEDLLKRLELWDKRKRPSRELSGGMKRRLMIARALMHEPKLLVLDEPTAGVDIELRRSMWDYLININKQGTTIILTTHYLEEAESLCRRLAIIDQGGIVAQGETKQLLSQLNIETFILDLKQALTAAPTIEACQTRLLDEMTLEVDIPKTHSINHVFDTLSEQGVVVNSLRNKSNRLEELFVRLVNKND